MSEALKIEGLQKTYENGFEALKGIDLSVEPGDFFALLGPNGAGKSTTIGIVSSLVAKTCLLYTSPSPRDGRSGKGVSGRVKIKKGDPIG